MYKYIYLETDYGQRHQITLTEEEGSMAPLMILKRHIDCIYVLNNPIPIFRADSKAGEKVIFMDKVKSILVAKEETHE